MNIQFNGVPFNAVPVSPTQYLVTATLNQLETAGLRNPAKVERATASDRKHEPKLAEAQDLRGQVQRHFDAARIHRAGDYATYIDRVSSGEILGGTPPITIYCPVPVEFDAAQSAIYIPYGTPIVAIDGETQTSARFRLRDLKPETGNMPIAVALYAGIEPQQAKQILHDINTFCTPIDKSKVLSLDGNGPLTRGTNEALRLAGFKQEEIERLGVKPYKTNKTSEISFKQANFGVAGAEVGLVGLQSKSAKNHVVDINSGASPTHINGAGQKFISDFRSVPSDVRKVLSPECVFILGVVHKERGTDVMLRAAHLVDATFKTIKGPAVDRQKAIFDALVGG